MTETQDNPNVPADVSFPHAYAAQVACNQAIKAARAGHIAASDTEVHAKNSDLDSAIARANAAQDYRDLALARADDAKVAAKAQATLAATNRNIDRTASEIADRIAKRAAKAAQKAIEHATTAIQWAARAGRQGF